MSKLKCEVVKDLLPLYKEKLCSDVTAELVGQHLEDCESCANDFDAINQVITTTGKEQIDAKDSFKKFVRKVNRKRLIYLVVGIALAAIIGLGGPKVYNALMYDASVVIPFDEITVSDMFMTEEGDVMIHITVSEDIVTGMNYSSTKQNPELVLYKRHFMPEMTREFQAQMKKEYTLNDVWIKWNSDNGPLFYGHTKVNAIWSGSVKTEVRKDFTDYKLLPVEGAVTTLYELELYNKYGID